MQTSVDLGREIVRMFRVLPGYIKVNTCEVIISFQIIIQNCLEESLFHRHQYFTAALYNFYDVVPMLA